MTERAARTKSVPCEDLKTASLIFCDSAFELNCEVMYSMEPSDAFSSWRPPKPGYNKLKIKNNKIIKIRKGYYKDPKGMFGILKKALPQC